MNEHLHAEEIAAREAALREAALRGAGQRAFELRSRQLFNGSIGGIDSHVCSRLTVARHAALNAARQAAAESSGRAWLFRLGTWTPAVGVTAAVLLGAALWLGGNHGMTTADGQPGLEDLDVVAAIEEDDGVHPGEAMEMLQNDLDFYDFADKAANPEPSASG